MKPRLPNLLPCVNADSNVSRLGLTALRLVVSTTCEACVSATAFIERKQAGRCNGATSPKAAVSGRDPHLPRRSTESRTRNLREACLPIDPSLTDLPAMPRVKRAGMAQRCVFSSA